VKKSLSKMHLSACAFSVDRMIDRKELRQMSFINLTPPPPPPPPSGAILSLISNIYNPVDHTRHVQALEARDSALRSSPESYGDLCLNLAYVVAALSPEIVPEPEITLWSQSDGGIGVLKLHNDPQDQWSLIREMSGLLLKNALCKAPVISPPSTTVDRNRLPSVRMRLPPTVAKEIKCILIRLICDYDVRVRRVTSIIIASAVVTSDMEIGGQEALPLREWKDLCPFLVSCLEKIVKLLEKDANCSLGSISMELPPETHCAFLGALQTLTKVLEDAPRQFERETDAYSFGRIVTVLLQILKLVKGKDVLQSQKDILACLVNLVSPMPSSLSLVMDDFLDALGSMGCDSNPEIRKLVCRAIVILLSQRTEYLQEKFLSITQFILTSTSDQNSDVSLEASEFWLTLGSLGDNTLTSEMRLVIESSLGALIPTLVKNMVYPRDKIKELIEQNVIDESQSEDQNKDINPFFHNSKVKGAVRNEEKLVNGNDESDNKDEQHNEREWTIRSCAAASLDTISGIFPSESIVPYLLPTLQEFLGHTDPWIREAGVLALGAVADGCSMSMNIYMDQIYPYLINQMKSPVSLSELKIITCWTLARYIDWAVGKKHSDGDDIIRIVTEAILNKTLDSNKRVQIAACSALGEIVEHAGDLLIPYLEHIVRILVNALKMYQTRSLMVLLNTLGTLVNFVGPSIGEGTLPGIYVPPLLIIWSLKIKKNPFDRVILPLMESLTSIAVIIEMNIQPWALEVFEGAMNTIESCMMLLNITQDKYDEEDIDLIVCATDLIDGLVKGLHDSFPILLASTKRHKYYFCSMLHTLIGYDFASVRVSALALMGDLAKQCPIVVHDAIGELITETITCIDPMYPSVCNNAVWAIGEVCVKCEGNPEPLKPYVAGMMEHLIPLLVSNGCIEENYEIPVMGLAENAASTMGRLAKVDPTFVAGDLPRFLSGW